MRHTLAAPIEFDGIGLHGGQPVRMVIMPAQAGHGIVFERIDVTNDAADDRDPIIPALYDLVSDTMLCTRLSNEDGVSVGTVEHVMAALAGTGVTDAHIVLDGPEVPILDGSSVQYVAKLAQTGLRALKAPLSAIRILRPVVVKRDGRTARLEPADRLEIDFSIDFDDRAVGRQRHFATITGNAFARELCDCRTFGRLAEVEALRKAGLARGGSLENAIVIDGDRVLNPGGLRRPDEFVRHKVLDAVGDLALAGAPILGRYTGDRAGHEMTNLLLRALFADPDAWEWAEEPDSEAVPLLSSPPAMPRETALAG